MNTLESDNSRLQADNDRLTANDLSRYERDQLQAVETENERLLNITHIQEKQIERLTESLDADRVMAAVLQFEKDKLRYSELEKLLFPNLEVESIDPMVRQYIAGMKELRDKLIRSQAEVERLKAANARLSAAFQETASVYGFAHSADCQRSLNDLLAPAIEVMEAFDLWCAGAQACPPARRKIAEILAGLKAIVEGGK